MRILGLDHGTHRIGVATSDETGVIALPSGYWKAEPFQELLDELKRFVREKEVGLIVVGMPRNMDGSYGEAASRAREFVGVLKEAVSIPIRTWDERLTTVQAAKALSSANVKRRQQREKVDATAAAIMLQSFLDASANHL